MSGEVAAPLKSMREGEGDRETLDEAEEKEERGSRVFCGDGRANGYSSNSCLMALSCWRRSAVMVGDGGDDGTIETAREREPLFWRAAAI